MAKKSRIYQLLRQAGLIYTRNDAIRLLKSGKVLVNHRPVYNPDFQVNAKKESVLVDGKPLSIEIPKKYFVLNKPANCLTSKKGSEGKKHIMQLIKVNDQIKNSLFPVGRLDYNTTGLIIITNDGKLAISLLSPKNKIEKEYVATVAGILTKEEIRQLESGITIEVNNKHYKTLPAKIKALSQTKQTTTCSITITEGKKRQVRLMFGRWNHAVLDLKRVRIGNLTLDNLKEGEYRELTKEEIDKVL